MSFRISRENSADLIEQVSFSVIETRFLMLGAEMGLGFQFEIPFQEGFGSLPPSLQVCHGVALAGMLLATVAVIVPMMVDIIVFEGHASPTTQSIATLVVEFALVPFGASLAASLAGCAWGTAGPRTSCLLAAVFFGGSIGAWYGLPAWRRHHLKNHGRRFNLPVPMKRSLDTPLATRMRDVLTEARIILPGAQAMLGFQMVAFLTKRFEQLPPFLRWMHLASVFSLLLTIILLMAPPAFHRIVEEGEETERLHRFAQRAVFYAAMPFALSIAGDFYVAADMTFHRSVLAAWSAAVLLLGCAGCWYGVPFALRARRLRMENRPAAA